MTIVTKEKLQDAAELVYGVFGGTPQYNWPLLSRHVGTEVWIKHENHTPTGAFKVRGGLVYMDDYRRAGSVKGVITATRGNHGQSIAFAASRAGVPATIVVPEGNSTEKNAAMRAFGGDLVVHGHDFQESFEYAVDRAESDGLSMLPSFDERLVMGVGTYAMELFSNAPDLERVYVPVGLGSGICGVISAREMRWVSRQRSTASSPRPPPPTNCRSTRGARFRPIQPRRSPMAWRAAYRWRRP